MPFCRHGDCETTLVRVIDGEKIGHDAVSPDASEAAAKGGPDKAVCRASALWRDGAWKLLVAINAVVLVLLLATPAAANTLPTGLPAISGALGAGETLTASSNRISDADGLSGATFAWQWVSNDGTTDSDIPGATAATYALTSAEVGKTIKVRVSFTDDGGNEETLVSAATTAIKPPLTVNFEMVPESQNANREIEVRLRFSDYVTLHHAAIITGGVQSRSVRISPIVSNPHGIGATVYSVKFWNFQVGDASLRLRAPSGCEYLNQMCSLDGRRLSQDAEVTIPYLAPTTLNNSSNHEPTGSLTILRGPLGSGGTLRASAVTIGDRDGLTGATFAWQWISNDGTADSDIPGATASTYTLTPAEVGKTIKVRVTFSDDEGNEATLFSEATEVVKPPLTASFEMVPANHDGSTDVELRLRFSDSVSLNRHGLSVGGASGYSDVVITPLSADPYGSLYSLRIPLRWDEAIVSVTLRPAVNCNYLSQVCSRDNRRLSHGLSVTIPPSGQPVVTTPSPILASENAVAITTLTATDADTSTADLVWSLAAGADGDKVTLSAAGVLAFRAEKDFEAPDDANQDGNYEVRVRVTDGANPVDTIQMVRLTDVDEVAPSLSTATVNGDELRLGFSEPLDESSIPASSAFTVTVNGTQRSVSNVSVIARTVTLTLTSEIVAEDTVTVGYTAPSGANASSVRDAAANAAATFSDQAVTNMSAPNRLPTGVPTISGTIDYGLTLTASASAIADPDGLSNAVFDWQWIRDCVATEEEVVGTSTTHGQTTLATYMVTSYRACDFKVSVTYTDDRGAEETLLSEAHDVFGNFVLVNYDENIAPIGYAEIQGTARVGRRLTARLVGFDDQNGISVYTTTYSRQWVRNDWTSDEDIPGATGWSYTPTAADVGKRLMVRVSYTDHGGYDETIVSPPFGPVQARGGAPARGSLTFSTPRPQAGVLVTASASGIADADGLTNAVFAWQWFTYTTPWDNVEIAGATAATYTPTSAEAGKFLGVRITFTDDAGYNETVVGGWDRVVVPTHPTISGTPRIGETLTASAQSVLNAYGSDTTLAWQWIANDGTADSDIAGATGSTYALTAAEAGKTIKARVAFTDVRGNEETLVSAATAAVAPAASEQQDPDDTDPPTVTITSDATGPVSGEFDVKVTFSEPVSGFERSEITVANGTASSMSSNGDGSEYTVTITPDTTTTGTLTVSVPAGVAIDGADNANTASGAFGIGVRAVLTAAFVSVPPEHDGETEFWLELSFDAAVAQGSKTHIRALLGVTGGSETRVRRKDGRLDHWRIRIQPSSHEAVTVTLSPSPACGATGAVCTEDGRALSEAISATVPGPASQTREVSIAAANPIARSATPASNSVTEGAAAAFTLTRTGSLADALTVNVSVTETGAMLNGTAPATATFDADSSTAELRVDTEDDEVDESASIVTAALSAGNGYSTDADAASATMTVEDDDATPVMTTVSPLVAPENGVTIATLQATDDDTAAEDLSWSVTGGADRDKVTLSDDGIMAFGAAKDFEVPDDANQDGDYEVTVRVTDGANPVDAPLTVRLADVDEIAPVLSNASVDGDALTLTFDEGLDGNSTPSASAFSVAVGGAARGVSDVSIGGSTVALTLASAVVAGETVTVSYTVPTGANARPLRDAVENAAPGFSDRAVTNTTSASNAAPTGLPTLAGTVRVGETLTASTSGIADADGLTNAVFTWQWIANDGTTDTAIQGATSASYALTSAEAGKTIKVRVAFTDDGGTEETLVSDATTAVAAANAAPTGLPTLAGTARAGETLTASEAGIADDDGLTNAVFAWQWIVYDGTADADIAGATASSFTLTASEVGKTVKVRVTFADDGGTEETLVSNATVAVAAALPVVSIEAVSSTTSEGRAAKFTLKRTGAVASALEVSVSATQAGAVLSGTPASTVTFAAGNAEARLRLATGDDDVAEADGRVTVSVVSGSGYGVDANASAATVDVYDNDEATTTAAETLWTSTLTVESIGGALLGTVGGGNALSPDGWSEDGEAFEVEQLYYFPQYSELAFTLSVAPSETGQLTLHLDDLQVQLRGSPGVRYFYWVVDHPGWQAGQTVAVKLTRTDPDAVAVAGPGLSVADTQVREAEGAVLSFRVTLEEAQASTVSVRYATSDGTATAGADYEAVSGALRFGPGETAKTVSVPVLNDTHDEGSETLTLALSAPFGAEVADGTATGTIVNTGPMPRAWITRFGRTVGLQAIEAIGDRLSGAGGTEVVVGGVGLSGPGAYAGTPLGEQADWPMGPEDEAWSPDGDSGRGMTGRELLLGSSFRLGAGGEDGAPSVTAWGRVASSSFDGEEAGMSLSGDVTTGFLGADMAHDSWLAGLAVGVSEGEGSFDDGAGDGRGTVESSLTSVYPYARFGLGDGVDIWGLVGVGSGDLKLTVGEEEFRTDLSMQMGALGLRGEVVPAEEAGDIELAVKTDVMWVRTESDAARSSTGGNLEAASGDVSRVRVALEGSRALAVGPGATFTPTLEIGLRHDAGDAETGTGVEVAAGLRYVDLAQGLTVEGNVRGLLTHSDEGYEEWGASGSVRLDPGVSGRGVSLSIGPVWGAASGGVDQLWAAGSPAGLAVDDAFDAQARLQAELGYGMRPPVGHGVLTPYTGLLLGEADSRMYRVGVRWNVGPQARFSLDGNREETSAGSAPTDTMMLRVAVRF